MTRDSTWLAGHLRDVPDFPKPGIVFKDMTPLLADVDAFRYAVDAIADHAAGLTVDKVVGIEARGFIFAAAGRLPARRRLRAGAQGRQAALEDGDRDVRARVRHRLLEIHGDAVAPGRPGAHRRRRPGHRRHRRGHRARSSSGVGGSIVGLAFVIELGFLDGRAKLPDHDILSLITV